MNKIDIEYEILLKRYNVTKEQEKELKLKDLFLNGYYLEKYGEEAYLDGYSEPTFLFKKIFYELGKKLRFIKSIDDEINHEMNDEQIPTITLKNTLKKRLFPNIDLTS